MQVTVSASSTVQYVNIKYSAGGAVVQLTVLPEQSGGDGGGEPTEGPGPILQQIPRLPGDDCSAVDRPELNWSGVESGGWTPSWSWWVNDGQGGPVCTRTLVYRQSDSTWFVDALIQIEFRKQRVGLRKGLRSRHVRSRCIKVGAGGTATTRTLKHL